MTKWIEVLVTMADGPQLPVSGTVRSFRDKTSPVRARTAHYGVSPIRIGLWADDVHVLRHGRKIRIDDTTTGAPLFISDGTTGWRFDPDHEDPVGTGIPNVNFIGPGKELFFTPPLEHWITTRRRPSGPVRDTHFAGRHCWEVELPLQRRDPVPPTQLVIDVETGAVLAHLSADGAEGTHFLDVTVHDEVSDDDPFIWTGQIRTPLDLGKEQHAREEEQQRTRHEWFRNHVADVPMQAAVTVNFTPSEFAALDEDTGAFEAMFAKGLGTLYRRPRSQAPWHLPLRGVRNFPLAWRAWSTSDFDWACALDLQEGSLTTDTIAELQRHLHPNDAVVGEPRSRCAAEPGGGSGHFRVSGATQIRSAGPDPIWGRSKPPAAYHSPGCRSAPMI
ncbi:hypothetical protein [Prescottella equi]|uniref:hypothetical protein n=1 Tax=Rhodococcus hoagii TaxID=43767 RepID=UPI00111BD892|nr:hypothetical protein [Prescottella equi]